MSFQSNDYISNLNLEFADTTSNHTTSPNDLALFSNTDFFDFDVFATGFEEQKTNLNTQSDTPAPANTVQESAFDLNGDFVNFQLPIKQEDLPDVQLADNFTTFESQPQLIDLDMDSKTENNGNGEDDKRRRNTAASARFRIKKKLREQQMENEAKELSEKVSSLEKKIKTLEMENKCLKNLILQQNEKKNNDLLENIKKRSTTTTTFQFTS